VKINIGVILKTFDHDCTTGDEVSMHVPGPPQGVATERWDKDIPAGQTLVQLCAASWISRFIPSCDTAWDQTRVCSDTSSLRPLRHSEGHNGLHFAGYQEEYRDP
jgi:hypothetical protein